MPGSDGRMSDVPHRLMAALRGRYTLERRLGSGGTAVVYLARDHRNHRPVAIKVLRPELAASLAADRFVREIEIAAALVHPHIVPLFDSGEADGFLYYVLPYLAGESLRERVAREGVLPVADAVRILRDMVDALAHAHSQGIVHRDIKPGNVLLTGRHAMVADFGVAKAVSHAAASEPVTTAGVAPGTPAYMAPEQAVADSEVDHRADLYAVGVVGYELLTGERPFPAGSPSGQPVAALADRRGEVPPQLDALVMRCLEPRPADRWQTAAEMLPPLESLVTPSDGTAVALPPANRRRVRGPVLAALLLFGVVGVWSVLRDRSPALDRNRVVVAPFTDRTTDSSLDQLGAMAASWTERGLLQTGVVQIVPAPDGLPGDSTRALVEFARQAGAGLLVTGAYHGDSDSIRFVTRIVDVTDGRLLSVLEPVAGTIADPSGGVERLRGRIMSGLRAVVDSSWGASARQMLGGSPPAYQAFQTFQESGIAMGRGDGLARLALLERAVALDSTFWWARVNLASSLMTRGRHAEADSQVRILEAALAELSLAEEAIVRGFRGRLDGNPAAMYHAVGRWAAVVPSAMALTNWAYQALHLSRPREAIRILQEVDPNRADMYSVRVLYWGTLIDAHYRLGEYRVGLSAARRARQMIPRNGQLAAREVGHLAGLGDLRAMATLLDTLDHTPSDGWQPHRVMMWAGLALMRHGYHGEGKELLGRAAGWAQRLTPEQLSADPWPTLWALWGDSREAEAAAFVRRIGTGRFGRGVAADSIALEAVLAARQNDRATAQRLRREHLSQPDERYPILAERNHRYWRAAMAAALGEREAAVRILQQWHARGHPFALLDPAFRSLHGFAPFEDLLRPSG